MSSAEETTKIKESIKQLPAKTRKVGSDGEALPESVQVWLKSIKLGHYADTFQKHLFSDFQKVMRIWDEELTTVLDIEKIGHRRRILASVGNEAALSAELETTIETKVSAQVAFDNFYPFEIQQNWIKLTCFWN